ncbi:MAG TPA: glycosyltransferase family 2 protein, partial [Fibrobacteria bacterium]|nr:glycosyltransferase family 2 protein [Fibrobacteria bacterium]
MSSASNSRTPKYSVVVVTYNSRDNIQVCLDSLRRHSGSGGDHEIIVVDNASRDGTPDYLSFREGIIALLEDENHGFSRACNLGAARATGEFLIFLNPDTLVTEGWSEAMARHCEDPAVGAVGPLSNYVAGLQRLDLHLPSPYKEGAKFPGEGAVEQSASVARVLKEANSGRGVTTKLLIGFCLMIRRELYAEMGGMDERLFLGNDDLDLSWRLRNRGLKLVVATDAFVFHEGQKSFRTEKKSHVDRLVQESTDALYLKLTAHYGGRDKVPSSMDLWGMNWFSPSPALLQGETRAAEARMANPAFETEGTHPRNNVVKAPESKGPAWKGLTALVWLGPGRVLGDEAARLERTLASLPPGCDTVVLNCSDWKGALPGSAIPTVRRLDLGEACTPRMAFEVAAAMAQERIFFCAAGVSSTALFNHWLDKRAASLPLAPVAFPVREDGSGEPAAAAFPGCALLCGKAWLRDAGAAAPASDP